MSTKRRKKQEQKELKTSAPRVNFMLTKQKYLLKSHKKFRNILKQSQID